MLAATTATRATRTGAASTRATSTWAATSASTWAPRATSARATSTRAATAWAASTWAATSACAAGTTSTWAGAARLGVGGWDGGDEARGDGEGGGVDPRRLSSWKATHQGEDEALGPPAQVVGAEAKPCMRET